MKMKIDTIEWLFFDIGSSRDLESIGRYVAMKSRRIM